MGAARRRRGGPRGPWSVLALAVLLLLVSLGLILLALKIFPGGEPPAGEGGRETSAAEPDFAPLGPPQPGEWLAEFDETGQSFQEYVRASPNRPGEQRRVLVFQPVGSFRSEERAAFERSVEFAGVYFQMPTRIESSLPLPRPPHYGRERTRGKKKWRQYQTGYFLRRLLPGRLPADAYAYLAVTMGDLYPNRRWNYVFGMASFSERVGVYSLVRFFPRFWGKEDTPAARLLALRRSCKLLTHEAGHMFGLAHCIRYRCNENGSNSLEEADGQPLQLCPNCLRKLQWNIGFDVMKRYRELLDFFEESGMDEEAEWVRRRMERIRAAPPVSPAPTAPARP